MSLTWIIPITVDRSSSQSGNRVWPAWRASAEVFLERPRQAQVDDVGPRNHHPPGGLLFEVQARFRSSSARCAKGGRRPRSRRRSAAALLRCEPAPPCSSGPGPSTQSVRLLALFKSQITGENTYDRITSGGAVRSTITRGARIARLLGACSPSAMCRKVTSESAAIGHGRDRDAEDHDRRRRGCACATRPDSTSGSTQSCIARPRARLATVIPICDAER